MNWKGNKVQYGAIHQWIRNRKYKPKFCQICHKKKNEYRNSKLVLANVSGKYKRNLDDWIYCHQSCHMREHKKGNHKNIKFKKYLEKISKDNRKVNINKKNKYHKNYINKYRPIISIKRKKHRQKPEIKLHIKNYSKKYGQRLEVKKRRRNYEKKYYQIPKNKLKRRKYGQLPKRKRYNKQYYQKNKKIIKIRNKKYREKNRKQILIKKKEFYQKHKEEIRQYNQRPEIKNRRKKSQKERYYKIKLKEAK